jgi:hypothetical protein
MPLSNLITHTMPFIISLVLVSTYRNEVWESLAHARWLMWFDLRVGNGIVFPEVRAGYREEQWRRVLYAEAFHKDAIERFTLDLDADKEILQLGWQCATWNRFVASKYPTAPQLGGRLPPWLRRLKRRTLLEKWCFDFAHFWGPLVLPCVWRALCDPEETYEINVSLAMYMLIAASLLGPSIVLALVARHGTLIDPVRSYEWHKDRVDSTIRARRSEAQSVLTKRR